MIQPWLNLAGLALDFAGFCLLLREWWLGFFAEGRQMDMAKDLARARKLRTFAQSHAPDAQREHLERSGQIMDEMAASRASHALKAARSTRKGMFVLASVLIVTGFALQIAAAWPL